MNEFIQWLAPIASTVIVTAATASINAKIASGEKTFVGGDFLA